MEIEDILQFLINKTGKTRDEILTLVEKKQLEAGGTISDKAAATLVSKDLGFKLSEVTTAQPTKIKDLLKMAPGSSNITITGLIKRMYSPYHFSEEDNTKVVQNILLIDASSSIRVVVWGTNVKAVKNMNLLKGDQIRILKGTLKNGRMGEREIHLNDSSAIEKIDSLDQDEMVDVWSEVLLPSSVTAEHTKIRELDLQGLVVKTNNQVEPERPATIVLINPDDLKSTQLKVNFWRERKNEVENLEIGQKILLEGVSLKEGLRNELEANFNRNSNLAVLGKANDIKKIEELAKTISITGPASFVPTDKQLGDITLGENFNVTVKISWLGKVGSFSKKTGEKGHFIRIGIYDKTGSNLIVLWNQDALTAQNFTMNDVIKINNCYLRENRGNLELSLSRSGSIEKLTATDVEESLPAKLPAIPINKLTKNWKVASLWGGILSENDIRTFKRNDGTEGRVKSIEIGDNTGEIRLVAWNDSIDLFNSIQTGGIIQAENLNIRINNYGEFEAHLSEHSTITVNKKTDSYPEWVKNYNFTRQKQIIKKSTSYHRITIDKLTDDYKEEVLNETDYGNDYSNFDNNIEIKANIVDVFNSPLYYDSCPQCYKKVEKMSEETANCPNHNTVEPVPRLLIRVILDDGLNTMVTTLIGTSAERATGFTPDKLKKFLSENNYDKEALKKELEDILFGNEYLIRGRLEVRKNFSQEDEFLWDLRINYIAHADPLYELHLLES